MNTVSWKILISRLNISLASWSLLRYYKNNIEIFYINYDLKARTRNKNKIKYNCFPQPLKTITIIEKKQLVAKYMYLEIMLSFS